MDFESLLLEAANPKTESDRLWNIKELSVLDRSKVKSLITALTDNPSSDDDMCIELLKEWPQEALASNRFQRLVLADAGVDWDDIFEEFSDALPVLEALSRIPGSHGQVIRLFEAELLERLERLSCSFDWKMTCKHTIKITWQQDLAREIADISRTEYIQKSQDFVITCSATVYDGNNALLIAPDKIVNIKQLFEDLNELCSDEDLLEILQKHGWELETEYTGDGGYFEIESVSPDLDGWSFSAELSGSASGKLIAEDPTGAEHKRRLPKGNIEDSYENYVLEESISLLGDVFEHQGNALIAMQKIIQSFCSKK